jgi:hypothetical protein
MTDGGVVMWVATVGTLAGAIVGSLLTYFLSNIAGARNEKRQNRLRVLGVLMAGRDAILSDEVRWHVNIIPVVFHDDVKVRRAYQHFCQTVGASSPDSLKRFVELILEITRSLGYSDKITEADINSGLFRRVPGPE